MSSLRSSPGPSTCTLFYSYACPVFHCCTMLAIQYVCIYYLFSPAVVEFGFETANYPTLESSGVVAVGVVKYGSSSLPLSVSLSTMSGSATSPQDFTLVSGQELTFSPIQSRQTANINILNDGIFEDTEEFTVLLSPVSPQSRVRLDGSNATTVQISDDDSKKSARCENYFFTCVSSNCSSNCRVLLPSVLSLGGRRDNNVECQCE